jgi:hypothetical protein
MILVHHVAVDVAVEIPEEAEGGVQAEVVAHHSGRYSASNVTDRRYTKEEWTELSYEDRQKVRDLRAKRNCEMNASAVTVKRNVIPRVTDESTIDTRSMTISAITADTGIGSQMSQRQHPRNRNTIPYD